MSGRYIVSKRKKKGKKQKKYMEEMKTTMEEYSQMMTQCGGTFPFTQPRDPRDPSGGGSGFPCST
ncbi:hypothetical protein BVRB_2g047060 [Beta vulgaris subsp. vulgaris]|uniref:Uncharacterized protein n=1 Tax=Beta vulgaris subsp. vulgaris TaxID=3555 RepID=A0A0J8BE59_BETVV|nr:hypothetical protein BVRB_2g047060 [Beta vulgaris subsp. vulgaris]